MRRSALSFALALVLSGSASGVPPTLFFDGDFPDAEWTVVTSSFEVNGMTPLPGGTATGAQVSTSGDAFRAITHNVPAAPSPTTFGAVWSAHFRNGATYDPAVKGPIGSIDYAEDAKRIFGSPLGQSAGVAIRQNGMVFVAQVGTTPENVFTRKEGHALKASSFGVMTDSGFPGGASPDFSASGGVIEFGFVRGNSTGAGGSAYTLTAAIDNWAVAVNPPCTQPSECDDGDPCTAEACVDGACTFPPLPCDDGDACTIDGCADGTCVFTPLGCDDGLDCTADGCLDGVCQHTSAATYELVDAKIAELQAIIASKECADATLAGTLGKKLAKKLKKARARLSKADDVTKDALIAKLVGKADTLLGAASSILASAVAGGLVTPACGEQLQGFIGELRQCVAGIPR
jgi:hypothetical protein